MSEGSNKLSFFVAGVPVPQGSMVPGVTRAGRPYARHASNKLKPWRTLIGAKAVECLQVEGCYDFFKKPVRIECQFYIKRPKGHFKKSGGLTKSAPSEHITKPDLDKLLRAVGDALEACNLVESDSNINEIEGKKFYCTKGDLEGVRITIISKKTN